jgi:hypothetical protein
MAMYQRWGISHRPISLLGYILDASLVVFSLSIAVAIDANSHSASDTLIGIFPYAATIFLLRDWLARNFR